MKKKSTTSFRSNAMALTLALGLALAYGVHSYHLFAQVVSYTPGVEGQIWQQLPVFGRGLDMNERPITTDQFFIDRSGHVPADVWPCTLSGGFPVHCYPSGQIGLIDPLYPDIDALGNPLYPDIPQNYAGRFAPCRNGICYPSGLIGVGLGVAWPVGPCILSPGPDNFSTSVSCYSPAEIAAANLTNKVPLLRSDIAAAIAGGFLLHPLAPPTGYLAGPQQLAVDNTTGTLYVTDHWTNRIQAFLVAGTPIQLNFPIGDGTPGAGPQQLNAPEGIQIDASGQLIVGDAGNSRVSVFAKTGQFLRQLPIPGARPRGIAITPGATLGAAVNPPNSRLVVTDAVACTIYIYDASSLAQVVGSPIGNNCASSSGSVLAISDISAVIGASIDNAGHIFVADYDRNRIEIFDVNGGFLTAFGAPNNVGPVTADTLNSPNAVLVDHRGVYAETDAQNVTHQVARVWVVDEQNQRLAIFKVNFDAATPTAALLFSLDAAGDLNGFPNGIAEDMSSDPLGRIVVTDSGNARIQRFQVPDLSVVNVAPSFATSTVSFDVVVAVGKDLVGVKSVVPTVCPTTANTIITSGVVNPTTGCSMLTTTGVIAPGQIVNYTFTFDPGGPTVKKFDIVADGNPDPLHPGTMATHSNVAHATVTTPCGTCAITAQVRVPHQAAPDTFDALVAPVAPSTVWTGPHVYAQQVWLRITATNQTVGLKQIDYRFVSGPETSVGAQPGLFIVLKNGAPLTATIEAPFIRSGTSILEYWGVNTDDTESPHAFAQLTIDSTPPTLVFRFDRATNASGALGPNLAGWWNSAVRLPLQFTGAITSVTPASTGLPLSPAFQSPLTFPGEGRNLGYTVTVTSESGVTTTKTSNVPPPEGLPYKIDMTPPTFVGTTITLEATNPLGAPINPTSPAALAMARDPLLSTGDAGSGVVRVEPKIPVANFALGLTRKVDFKATDAAGNASTQIVLVIVTVQDTTPPVIAPHVNLTIEAGSAAGAIVNYTPPATSDAVDGPGLASCLPNVGAQFPFGPTTVTCRATDAHGNVATPTMFTITVVDTTAPLIAPHADVTFEATSAAGATVGYTSPATSDAVDGARTANCTPNSPGVFALGSTAITCNATDNHGNVAAPTTFNVVVVDRTPPTIQAPPSVTVSPDPGQLTASGVVLGTPTTADLVGVTSVTNNAPATYPVGATTVTWTARDAAGNSATATQTVTVNKATSSVTVTCPVGPFTYTGSAQTPCSASYATNDGLSGSLTVTYTNNVNAGTASASASYAGDASHAGSSNSATFTIGKATSTVTVTCPASVSHIGSPLTPCTAAATGVGGLNQSLAVTYTNNTNVGSAGASASYVGDANHTSSTGSGSFAIVDTTPPVITVPANFTVGATSSTGATVTYTATANDLVDGSRAVSCTPSSGTLFPIGPTTVTCISTDSRNNSTQKSFVVTVSNQPPTITQANVSVVASSPAGAVATFTPTVVDPVDGINNDPVTCTPKSSGAVFPIGATTVTCKTTDSVGLTASVTFTVTVTQSLPVCTAVAAPSILWPPNHKLQTISINGVTTADGGTITTTVTSIFQDEPTQGLGDGDTPMDGFLSNGVAQVRAERSGLGDGRVYYLSYTSTTPGGSCTGTVTVSVPHDMAHPAVGEGPKYDSTNVSSGSGDNCHGESDHGHHDGDGCLAGHHGHFDGDECQASDGFHHDGDGHGGGKDGGKHPK